MLTWILNKPRSIYQYSNMDTRFSGQISTFGGVFFVSKSPLGIIHLGPAVQRLDNAIHWINHYPADSVVCFFFLLQFNDNKQHHHKDSLQKSQRPHTKADHLEKKINILQKRSIRKFIIQLHFVQYK